MTAVGDPGLQPQRTALSWTRTSAAVAANGMLVAGRDVVAGAGSMSPVTGAAVVLAAISAVVIYLTGRRRSGRLGGIPFGDTGPAHAAINATGIGIVVVCVSLLTAALV